MADLVFASDVEVGQHIILRSGTYLIDAVAIERGRVHIGTVHGVLVLGAATPVLVVDP